jgi:hypothetical protein
MGISWNRPDNWYIAYFNNMAKDIHKAAERISKSELTDKDDKAAKAAKEDPLGDFRQWLDPSN